MIDKIGKNLYVIYLIMLSTLIVLSILGVIFLLSLIPGKTIEVINLSVETMQVPTKTMQATVTGYSSTPDQTDSSPTITAYNTQVRKGIVANNCLPRGTMVIIDGVTMIVEDRKNSRYGCEWFDIWFESREEALEWGVKQLIIVIK